MSEPSSSPLWYSNCGGREWTRVPGGRISFSDVEVTCDACGTRYRFAENLGAHFARAEQERLEQDSSTSADSEDGVPRHQQT
jgi:RNase P subunit RPR2